MAVVYTLGESILDIIFNHNQPIKASPGGSALNTAVSLARIGIPGYFIGAAGNDIPGQLIKDFLVSNHIKTNYFKLVNECQTPISLAFLDENADASYTFYRNNVPQINHFILPETKKNDFVLIGSYFAVEPSNHSQILQFLKKTGESGATIYYDLNFRRNHLKDLTACKNNIETIIHIADIVKASEEDLSNVFGETDLEIIYSGLKPEKELILIKTAGKDSVQMISKEMSLESAVPEIKPISTIGAGDSFNAGIIYSLIRHLIDFQHLSSLGKNDWTSILNNGIQFSSAVCMSFDNYISSGFIKKQFDDIS